MRLITILAAAAGSMAASAGLVSAEDGSIRDLPVPALTIPAGQIINEANLTERRFRTSPRSLAGIATQSGDITGKEARRALLAGRPIPLSALMKPLAVRRGEKVAVSYEDAGLSISTQLLALEDGSNGDLISLRNLATGIVIHAEVMSSGKLAVRDE
jgi:flagella basal body P-ring formation protein FlgA